MSAPYVPGPTTLNDPSAAASATWTAQLPKIEDYNNDVTAWLAAVKAYAATANGGPAFPATPSDQQMQDAFGPGWSAAGVNSPISLGEYQAKMLNYDYLHQGDAPINGPSFGLRMQARDAARPDQMQAAYNAVNPDTGEPFLLPQIGGYLESTYAMAPSTQAGGPPGTDPGSVGGPDTSANPPGGTYYDPQSDSLVVIGKANPDPSSGLLEVPNGFDPNDPNAPKILQAMRIIATMQRQGSLYASPELMNYLTDILTPLGIDPSHFVVGVLNYNDFTVNDDGTLTAGANSPGLAPATPGPTTTPPGTTQGSPDWGADDPALYNFYNSWGWQKGADGRWGPPAQPAVNNPAVGPDQSPPGGPVERPKPESNGVPGQVNAMAAQPGSFPMPAWQGGQPAGPSDPQGGLGWLSQQTPQLAAQLHQQYGPTSTIDPRYPDWMVLHKPPGKVRPMVNF